MGLYPGSVDHDTEATIYGTLPDHDKTNVALVLHTSETVGMPSFGGDGSTAPHYVYAPTTRIWTMWAEYEYGYVGPDPKVEPTARRAAEIAFGVERIGGAEESTSNDLARRDIDLPDFETDESDQVRGVAT